MRQTITIPILLIILLCLAAPVLAEDWSSIIPPDARPMEAKPVPTEKKTLKVGEVLTIPLPGSRSYECPVEIDGQSLRIVDYDPLSSLTVQAARPGRSTIRIYQKFWRDPDVRDSNVPVGVMEITVEGRQSPRLGPPAEREAVPEPRQTGPLDWEGHISRQAEELLTVVADEKQWQVLWREAFGLPAPKVDFGKYAVACVFLGYNADWLYDIHIGKPTAEGGLMRIPFGLNQIVLELSGPFRASGQYRMKAVERQQGLGMVLARDRDSGPR